MEQKVILKTKERCIFLIKESNLDFYLVIPNNRKVSLVLGIFLNIQEEMVKNLTEYPDKAIVLPMVPSNVLEGVKLNQTSCFEYLDRLLSILINTTYKILSFNHIDVSEKILLHHNLEYTAFNKWFYEKYQGRIELVTVLTQEKSSPSIVNSEDNLVNPEQISPSRTINTNIANPEVEKLDTTKTDSTLPETEKTIPTKEPGFVSYVLLGVVVAVVSLIFLYLII